MTSNQLQGTSMGLFSKVLQQPVMPPVAAGDQGHPPNEPKKVSFIGVAVIDWGIDWGISDKSRGMIQDVLLSRPALCTKHYSPANQHGWLKNHHARTLSGQV